MNIWAIHQDTNGHYWFGSNGNGVFQYDGKGLLYLPIEKGGVKVYLISIYEDRQGVIWLGTNNNGVYRWNGEAFEPFEPWM